MRESTGSRSYKKDKKITFLLSRPNESPEPGVVNSPIENGENIWAYYRHASTSEYNNAIIAMSKVEVVFKVRWRNDITTKMTVLFRNIEYGITRIDDFEGYKQDLTIYAYAIV